MSLSTTTRFVCVCVCVPLVGEINNTYFGLKNLRMAICDTNAQIRSGEACGIVARWRRDLLAPLPLQFFGTARPKRTSAKRLWGECTVRAPGCVLLLLLWRSKAVARVSVSKAMFCVDGVRPSSASGAGNTTNDPSYAEASSSLLSEVLSSSSTAPAEQFIFRTSSSYPSGSRTSYGTAARRRGKVGAVSRCALPRSVPRQSDQSLTSSSESVASSSSSRTSILRASSAAVASDFVSVALAYGTEPRDGVGGRSPTFTFDFGSSGASSMMKNWTSSSRY